MHFSERVYRFLLRAYPGGYRARYAEPMEQLFRDRLRDARTFADRAVLWARTLADWLFSVLARYWEAMVPNGMSIDLGDPARRCIFFARYEASSFSRRQITVEDLLLGILRQEPSLVGPASVAAVRRAIEVREASGRRTPPMEDLRLSDEAIRAVAAAREIAEKAGRPQVTPRDLATGILREAHSLAAGLLREHSSGRF